MSKIHTSPWLRLSEHKALWVIKRTYTSVCCSVISELFDVPDDAIKIQFVMHDRPGADRYKCDWVRDKAFGIIKAEGWDINVRGSGNRGWSYGGSVHTYLWRFTPPNDRKTFYVELWYE